MNCSYSGGLLTSQLREHLREDVLVASQRLLGCILIRGERRAKIIEVEAYRAEGDAGSHAFRGPTPRNQAMYGPPGHAYVYFNYGCHWMLNVVAHQEGCAAAILVRAAKPLQGLELMKQHRPKAKHDWDLLSGPGKLAAAFEITHRDYGIDLLSPHSDLRIEPGSPVAQMAITPRIGLAKGKGDDLPWRFIDSQEPKYLSKR